jgi:hypothetical protein
MIFGPSESPETDPLRTEPHFDFLPTQPGEITTCLDPDASEQGEKRRIGIEHPTQHSQGMRHEEGPVLPRRHDDDVARVAVSGHLGGDRRSSHASPYAGCSLLPDDGAQLHGQRSLGQSARIGPEQPSLADGDPRSDSEERVDQAVR